MTNKNKAILISITSDIGRELALKWKKDNWIIGGTYRTKEDNYSLLNTHGMNMCYADMLDNNSINDAITYLKKDFLDWNTLVLCPASQDPIGKFQEINFDEWERSIIVNFTSQLRVLHGLLPFKNKNKMPTVILFAGGGTNNATIDYSAYTISKIASIKMTELLDAEIQDVKFIIYGPGWVKTKIHQATLDNKDMAGDNYEKTIYKLNSDECTPMDDIIQAIDWGLSLDKEIISGRNISVVFDKWGTTKLEERLRTDNNIYKLRRYGND